MGAEGLGLYGHFQAFVSSFPLRHNTAKERVETEWNWLSLTNIGIKGETKLFFHFHVFCGLLSEYIHVLECKVRHYGQELWQYYQERCLIYDRYLITLGSKKKSLGVAGYACNGSVWEITTGRGEVKGQPWVHETLYLTVRENECMLN